MVLTVWYRLLDSIDDDWILDNMSLAIIDSQINRLWINARDGKKKRFPNVYNKEFERKLTPQ